MSSRISSEIHVPQNRIALIGFMGSGKTYLGKKIASEYGFNSLDLDTLIEQKAEMSIAEIFNAFDEKIFREIEKEILQKTLHQNNFVLSCGGGTPCFYDNIDLLIQHSVCIYLKTPNEVIFNRLKAQNFRRPSIQKMNDDELRYFIESKMQERLPYYQKAQITIDSLNFDMKVLKENIDLYNNRN
jgi:shikimate kinase